MGFGLQSYPKPMAKPKPTDVQIKTHKYPNKKLQIQRTLQGDRENFANPVEGELWSSQLMGFGLQSYPKPTAKPKPTDVQIKTHKYQNQKSQIQRTLQGNRENFANSVEGELRSL